MAEIIEMPKRQIIIGKKELYRDKFKPIENETGFIKPIGGLWASPYYPNNKYISGWHEYCIMDNMEEYLTNDSVVIEFKDSIKSFIINSQEDLIELFNIVGESGDELSKERKKTLNFEASSKLFDVIYLTDRGQLETRMPLENYQYNLYGWDCESTLIMNFDCIEKWEYKNLNII